MIFEVGKYYRHLSGSAIHILADVETTMWKSCLLAERFPSYTLVPISKEFEHSTINWNEITEEEWQDLFVVPPDEVSIDDFSVKFIGRV